MRKPDFTTKKGANVVSVDNWLYIEGPLFQLFESPNTNCQSDKKNNGNYRYKIAKERERTQCLTRS
jgi:hypothetical protein